jgi:ABC-type Fe3+/spermidine/putrescine transport system ATPase subunit
VSNAVELDNIVKKYGGVIAVDRVSLEVEKNTFFSILGPSGCGKTTILRIIAGLETPDAGFVKMDGSIVNNVPPEKRGVGLVFQGTAVFPHMNVFNNIAYGLKMRKVPKHEVEERVRNVMRLVNLPPEVYGARRVDQLSGGERQRVEIARSLVLEPKVLLLDEPLGPLDFKIRQKMQAELKRLQKTTATTFIYVTHDQTEALSLSDKIAVMRRGKVVQVGTPEEIYNNPSDQFVADFIGESNLLEGRVEGGFFYAEGLPPIALNSQAVAGGKAVIAIRPERVEMLGAEKMENHVNGVVVDKTYQGVYTVFRVQVGKEHVFTVYVTRQDVARQFAVGDSVVIGWRSSDCMMVGGL